MKKHLWVMILCCLIPVVAIIFVRVMGIQLGYWSTALFLLLCPLSHIVLMWAMRHEDHGSPHHSDNPGTVPVQTPTEITKHFDYKN